MALLQDYLRSVRLYLPPRTDRDDILTELSAHLQATLDDREEELGRALTQDEETAVLWGVGEAVFMLGTAAVAHDALMHTSAMATLVAWPFLPRSEVRSRPLRHPLWHAMVVALSLGVVVAACRAAERVEAKAWDEAKGCC